MQNTSQSVAVWMMTALALSLTLLGLWDDWRIGGDAWQQGDWLISGFDVRRGPAGSLFLSIADLTGLSPVTLVVLLQSGCAILLFALTGRAYAVAEPHYLLIFFSPAFFVLAWTADPLFGVRKEMLGFLALALAGIRPRLAAALFVAAAWAHEVNVVLAPAFWMIWRGLKPPAPWAGRLWLIGSALAAVFAMTHRTVDPARLCAPLLHRGLQDTLCSGAIDWMELDGRLSALAVINRLMQPETAAFVGLVLVIQTIFLLLCLRHERAGRTVVIFVILGVSLVPILPVSVDWGRWLSIQVTAFGFVMLARARVGQAQIARPMPGPTLALLCVAGLLFAPYHFPAVRFGGVADRIFRLAADAEPVQGPLSLLDRKTQHGGASPMTP